MVFDARAAKALQPGDAMAVAEYPGLRLAICKTRYDELASQVNQILDIEERRQQGGK